jgi:hypothetical protein
MNQRFAALGYLFTAVLASLPVYAQEPEVFTRADFDLRGPVKSCVVKANYGEEHFEFDRDGRLTKSLTRYNDADYDITYYFYQGGDLRERRDEVYRNKTFDQQTSIAHFYERDTVANRLLERIVSYDRNFQEQVVLEYDEKGILQRIVRSDPEGVDETQVEYASLRDEQTTSFLMGGVLQKSVRTSSQGRGEELQAVELTKEYLEGQPQRAREKTRDSRGLLLAETLFHFDPEKNEFTPEQSIRYSYNDIGLLVQEKILVGAKGEAQNQTRQYVYQMDGADPGNWVRQVITPDNTVVVRQITYYKPELPESQADSVRG